VIEPARAGVGEEVVGRFPIPSPTPSETVYEPAVDGAVQTEATAEATEGVASASIARVRRFSEYVAVPPNGLANDPPVAVNAASVETLAIKTNFPPASIVAVCAVPEDESFDSKPRPAADAPNVSETAVVCAVAVAGIAAPVEFARVATNNEAFTVPAKGETFALPAALCAEAVGTTAIADNVPKTNAEIVVIAKRLRIVVFDICFLSLVKVRHFLTLARRSFDLLIPSTYGTHV
jgi:hypothetical protein